MSLEVVNGVLSELGAEIGIEGLQLHSEGAAEITFESDVVVELAFDEERSLLVLESNLGPRPGVGEAVMRTLLKNNYVWNESPVQFAIRPDSDDFVQQTTIEAQCLDLEVLKQSLARLVAGAEAWEQILAGGTASGELPTNSALRV